MALNKTALKNGLMALFADMRTRTIDSDEEFAMRLTDLIDDYVKSGDGKITVATLMAGNIPVTGTATVIVKQQ